MNWRALGCGGLAAAVFVLVGALGIWRALGPEQCPDGFEHPSGSYEAVGARTSEPRLRGVEEDLVAAGEIFIGSSSWRLWVAPDQIPETGDDDLPEHLAFACPDGTFQAYAEGGG